VKNVSPSALLLIIRHRRLLLRLADTDGTVKLNPNHLSLNLVLEPFQEERLDSIVF
jgi:hypothetical protein